MGPGWKLSQREEIARCVYYVYYYSKSWVAIKGNQGSDGGKYTYCPSWERGPSGEKIFEQCPDAVHCHHCSKFGHSVSLCALLLLGGTSPVLSGKGAYSGHNCLRCSQESSSLPVIIKVIKWDLVHAGLAIFLGFFVFLFTWGLETGLPAFLRFEAKFMSSVCGGFYLPD